MTRSLLPPRGLFVPAAVIYNPHLPPSIALTWIQLRGLAWGRKETPALSLQQVSNLTGRSQSTIYEHMTALRLRGALRWRTSRDGTIIVSFDDASWLAEPPQDTAAEPVDPPSAAHPRRSQAPAPHDSGNLETPAPLPPPENLSNQSEEEIRAAQFRNSGKPESDPLKLFKQVTGILPNRSQRARIRGMVEDPERWRETLEHWMVHRWNPNNLPGILDLYARGGPPACVYCLRLGAGPPTGSPTGAPVVPSTAEVLEELRQEYRREYRQESQIESGQEGSGG